jgi:hypothetical protein
MNDNQLNQRIVNYKKCNFQLLEKREEFNLTLRKQKINDMLMMKRISTYSIFEISPLSLNIDAKYKSRVIDNLVNMII